MDFQQTVATQNKQDGMPVCVSTKIRVTARNCYMQIFIPGGQAVWWQCPECGGWHISQIETMSPIPGLINVD